MPGNHSALFSKRRSQLTLNNKACRWSVQPIYTWFARILTIKFKSIVAKKAIQKEWYISWWMLLEFQSSTSTIILAKYSGWQEFTVSRLDQLGASSSSSSPSSSSSSSSTAYMPSYMFSDTQHQGKSLNYIVVVQLWRIFITSSNSSSESSESSSSSSSSSSSCANEVDDAAARSKSAKTSVLSSPMITCCRYQATY